ncbi:serine/threonine protein kinase [Simplicispira psychrophila]|uniref:serine/threonine protein kinase n=1 Tax=Simplicispira psychrophila TaxID=80882 RepID=UPI0005686AFB|nr:serine/threonine-protein kinase [Simplicispira psychrophila]
MIDIPCSAAVKEAPHADALSPGTRLAEFEILSILGVGGFGVVYKAFDHSLHRAVAIKEYLPLALAGRAEGLSVSVRTLSDQPAFQSGLKSFVGEARLLAQFDHPSLVKVFRFWEAHNTAYMVMPLYNGMTLKQARAQMRTPPPEAWLRQVLWSVLGALRMLHESQTLHRDISPDNIFLQDMGPPVLLDLGAARHAINDRDHKHTAVLKVNYAPIEQYADGDADLPQGPWGDLYSLAAVVHGCLCNDTPLPSTLRSIRDRMVPFARVAKTVHDQFGQAYSPAFVAAVGQSLALRPEDRPQSIDAFLYTLDMVSPPAALEHFDFRAELGDIWVEPTDQAGPGLTAPTVDLTNALLGQLSGRFSSREGGTPALPAPGEVLSDAAAATESAVAPVLAAPSRPDALPAVAPVLPLPVAHASAPAPVDDTDFVLASAGPVVIEDSHEAIFLDAGDSVLRDDLEHGSTPPASAPLWAAASAPPQPTRKKPLRRIAWLAAAVVSLGALGYGWMGHTPASTAEDTMITEMAEPEPAPAAPTLARAPEPVPQKEVVTESASPAVPAGPLPAFVDVSSKHPEAASAAPQRRSAKVSAVSEGLPASSAAPVPTPAPAVPASKPPPEPAQALCADTNFFTRSACVYSECAKPANAALALCAEHRSRLQKQANSVSGN